MEPDPTPPTPTALIAQAQEHLTALRKRLYPVLSQWNKHGLEKMDNTMGFYLLDALQEDLRELEWHFGSPAREE